MGHFLSVYFFRLKMLRAVLICVLVGVAIAGDPPPGPPRPKVNFTVTTTLIPMDDGSSCYTQAFELSPAPFPGKKRAAVYEQIPYSGNMSSFFALLSLVAANTTKYPAVSLMQTTEGLYNSTGTFDGMRKAAPNAKATVRWLKQQPWWNGAVLSTGISAMGISCYLMSTADIPITAQYIQWATPDVYATLYPQGAFCQDLGQIFKFVGQPQFIDMFKKHETLDSWWTGQRLTGYSQVKWPAVHVAGWYDVFLQPQLAAYEGYQKQSHLDVRGSNLLFVDNHGHCFGGGDIHYNATAANITLIMPIIFGNLVMALFHGATNPIAFAAAMVEWRAVTVEIPRIIWYVMGSGAEGTEGHYVTHAHEWPKAKTQKLYLNGSLGLSSTAPQPSSLQYIYNPADPVPTVGGCILKLPGIPGPSCGGMDQRLLSRRSDVLAFTAPPLTEPLALTGRPAVVLAVSTNVTDTDFTAKLLDVFPNGTRLLIQDGAYRMLYRGGTLSQPAPLVPGHVYEIRIELAMVSYIFQKGHSVGLDVSSSNFPRFSANPNSGQPLSTPNPTLVVAANRVHLGAAKLELPEVDRSDLPHYRPPKILLDQVNNFDAATLEAQRRRIYS
eukprot:TRINITY_DN4491_c0_g1_i1.p1 TRINITY_DN4491_c0_g1~~TRINITY_DN4491_c0_g1_i1.p1  ORF type:complete len:609 (+),score=146.74 TRINITY_DN4491_c0_g1_i1:3-1829(+)